MNDVGDIDSAVSVRSHVRKPPGTVVSIAEAVARARAKWPKEVRHVNQNNGRAVRVGVTVFEGYRQLVLPDRRFRFEWRSLAGVGFWVTAKDAPVFNGKTLTEATLKLAEWANSSGMPQGASK